MIRLGTLAAALLAPLVAARATEPLLDVFPQSVAEVPAARRGEATITRDYTASGSTWA